ncbi:MAG: hypothetical protein HY277_03990 [Ignavibacteriales bacterium]|nr:hypothetical protein [Ignavibacteriales bacterium]
MNSGRGDRQFLAVADIRSTQEVTKQTDVARVSRIASRDYRGDRNGNWFDTPQRTF